MKKMILMALAGAMSLFVCSAGFAEDMMKKTGKDSNMTMEQKMARKEATRLETLTKRLSLTPDQKDKVSAILKSNDDQKKALMTKMKEDEKALKESEDTQIKAVLTADQQVKYDKMLMDQKEKMEKKIKEKKEMKK